MILISYALMMCINVLFDDVLYKDV